MTSTRKILTIAIFLLGHHFTGLAQAPDAGRHWYRLQVESLSTTAGTSTLAPEAFAKALAGTEFIRLDNAVSQDATGKWSAVAIPPASTVFIRPQLVQTFIPLDATPKDADRNSTK